MSDFIHLHNHSHYSLQDAACTVEDLVMAAKKNDMHAVALTDHGVMFGVIQFYKKAKAEGIKPIIGMEAYVDFEKSRFEKVTESENGKKKSKHYSHLLLLAKNETGYKNLMKISTIGHTEGFYYKPRIDLEVLTKYKDGLICTSACPAGPISTQLINNNWSKAKEIAIKLKELFGDDFYLEIQDHGMDIEKPILAGMPKLAKELGIKLVATNDIHYIDKDHSIAHNILLLLGDKTGNADYRELRYGTDQIYFKTEEEMKKIFKNYKGAIENTLEIEEKVNLILDFNKHHFPIFPLPDNAKSLEEYLVKLAYERLEKRFKKITPEIEDRLKYELDVINQMGYAGYFLIVQDFINASKQKGIPVGPGRGSAAGSLVAYVLGITNVNPLEYDLLFERFLNPARKSMPDIDVDFADDKREEVINYVKAKYGENSVAQIITFNRLSSRQVIRDVARVLKIPIPQVDNITKWIPQKFGRVYTIDQALEEVPELQWIKKSDDPVIQELIKYAKILEGMNRNASKHAAGVVITPGDVSDYVPLAIYGEQGETATVTQFNMKDLEEAGILKMDFLGLDTLSIIRDTIELVKETRGEIIDIENIPVDDPKTYELFAKGQTTAVFQFESAPMKEYLKKLRPTSIKDLAAMNALYRPGPMEFIDDFIARKHGKKEITYLHPVLEPILKETYGIIVYQEQVIQIANKVAGMSLAEADLLRRAMGKKDLKAMQEQRDKFIKGAAQNNIDEKIAGEIFDAIDKFANYGFNKSHAVAYSILAYQTAYLKAHYLEEFLAANLSNKFDSTEKVTILLEDCRKLGIKVQPPDINYPTVRFQVKDGKIIFGMAAIKNVGIQAVEEIKRAHDELGRDFRSIYDFCANVDTRIVNKRALEGLVLAGAFDSLGGTRAQHFAAIEEALEFGSKVKAAKESYSNSLFSLYEEEFTYEEPSLPDVKPWDSKEKLAKERQVLGFYLSGHPLHQYEIEYNSFATVHLGEPETYKYDEIVRACGVITEVSHKIDKSGKQMAFFRLDDFTGSCECLMFSKIFKDYGELITLESTILVKGRLESSGDAVKLHVEEAYPLSDVRNKFTKRLGLILDSNVHSIEVVDKIKELVEVFEGDIPVLVCIKDNGNIREFVIDYKVSLTDEFIDRLKKVVGIDNIQLFMN
ncbi:MAG: DNA polymerase III subunit alpha [Melioribacter sp.]|nr:DNA polymerase III subunit alpha [Melioribacter sp.]